MYNTLGLMSGTSMDGVDVALIQTDGQTIQKRWGGMTYLYPAGLRSDLKKLVDQYDPLIINQPFLDRVEAGLTHFHADIVQRFLVQNSFKADLISFHGHSIYHAPPATVQIGNGHLLYKETGIPVVYDLRKHDVDMGGQGAPLVPIYHKALFPNLSDPIAVINVGGISNITVIEKGRLIAGDVGPGNVLIDEWIFEKTGAFFDKDGQIASYSLPDETLVEKWMSHNFFSKKLPKSLDRRFFCHLLDDVRYLSLEEGMATLTLLTATCIVQFLSMHDIKQAYICGGGVHNKTLMQMIQTKTEASVRPLSMHVNIDESLVEAEAWAYIAVRALKGLPYSFPETTGCPSPLCGGKFVGFDLGHSLAVI